MEMLLFFCFLSTSLKYYLALRITGLEFSLSQHRQLCISKHLEKVMIFNISGLMIVVTM